MNEPIARAEWWGQMQESKIIKRDESAAIARQTAEFLARGGEIDYVSVDKSAYDFSVKPVASESHQASAAKSNRSRESNKSAEKIVERNAKINTHHMAILHAVYDLEKRKDNNPEIKTSLNEIRKLTGQTSDALNRRMDALIVRGYITEGVRNYHTTESGRAYIGQVEMGNEKGDP